MRMLVPLHGSEIVRQICTDSYNIKILFKLTVNFPGFIVINPPCS